LIVSSGPRRQQWPSTFTAKEPIMMDAPRWYSTDELAELLGIDASSLRRWRTAEPLQGPPFVRVSARKTIYNAADVEAWLASRRVDPAA
jgi:hypothetical protein